MLTTSSEGWGMLYPQNDTLGLQQEHMPVSSCEGCRHKSYTMCGVARTLCLRRT
jgi:hypothetical protein